MSQFQGSPVPGRLRRWVLCSAVGALWGGLGLMTSAQAHGTTVGTLSIEHPYATPTPAAATSGAVYFRALRNSGDAVVRVVSAQSPVAESVEFHEMRMDGDVMRMRAAPALEVPAKGELKARHGGQWHLMLTGLKQPLKDGDRFTLTLDIQPGGKQDVVVWVQSPRQEGKENGKDAKAAEHQHAH